MRIEAVTVCINYSDFLMETARHNHGLLDNWIIVTEKSDVATREVCRKFNLKCVLSDDGSRFGKDPNGFSGPGKGFAKGRLVERGLQHLSADGWRLHIDADVVLPTCFRQRLAAADLQEDMIYGLDRVLVKSWDQWQKIRRSNYLQEQVDYHCRLHWPSGCEIATRWTHPVYGYVPIGFFQMWHSSEDEWRGIRVKTYPTDHGSACRTDVQHALQWDRHKRALIPEMVVLHLESEPLPKGANWKGRTSKPFGPSNCQDPGKVGS